jgi:tripartite ATP-independent transporter DctM subunit
LLAPVVTWLLILLLVLLVAWLLASGTEYAYVIGAAAVALMVTLGLGGHLAFLPQRIFSQLDVFTLMALPMFILAGEIMGRGGVTEALTDFAVAMLGRIRGALGHVNVLTSLFFGGVSGSAIADAAALGNALVPPMKAKGYPAEYAASITAASAIIGPIVPPSVIMIMYGALMQTDIAALFAAGILPGVLLAAVLMTVNAVVAARQGHPRGDPFALARLARSFVHAAPALLLPVLILGGIVFGVTTPTEAGALAVIAAWAASRRYRPLVRADLGSALERTVVLTGSIFVMIAAAGLVGYIAAVTGATDRLSAWVLATGLGGNAYVFAMVTGLLIVGMFTGVRIALFLVVPLVAPEAIAQGVHPVHLGMVVCFALTLGLITPPFGPVLMITSSVTGVSYAALVRGTFVFLMLELVVLVVLILVPGLSLAVPRALGLL